MCVLYLDINMKNVVLKVLIYTSVRLSSLYILHFCVKTLFASSWQTQFSKHEKYAQGGVINHKQTVACFIIKFQLCIFQIEPNRHDNFKLSSPFITWFSQKWADCNFSYISFLQKLVKCMFRRFTREKIIHYRHAYLSGNC